jgi:arylformamidase
MIYDISLPISQALPVWPGDPPVHVEQVLHLDRGDQMTLTRLEMGAHTGTHVDAPAHFVAGGMTVDALDLEMLVGPALVVGVPDAGALTAEVLDRLDIPAGALRLLFRTRNSDLWERGETGFYREFVGVTADGAQWLVDRGVQLVGIDYLSVSPYDDPIPPHQVLLGARVIVLEGLNLSAIAPGTYDLICLPLCIRGAEGAPARAILVNRTGRGD